MRFLRVVSCTWERSRRLLLSTTLILLFTLIVRCYATVIPVSQPTYAQPRQDQSDIRSTAINRATLLSKSSTQSKSKPHNTSAVPDILDQIEEIRLNGRCSCPPVSFERRYQESYGSVRTFIEQVKSIPTSIPQLRQLEYLGRSTARYKGPQGLKDGMRFKIRAYVNPDLCGLRLLRNKEYLLNLNNPWTTNSVAGSVPRGTYFISQCDKTYTWQGLSVQQQSFLRAKRQ